MTRRSAPVALLIAAALAGCGGGEETRSQAAATPEAESVGEKSQGSVVQYADCADWRKGSAAQKRATVVELRSQLTPQGDPDAESTLPDAEAFKILERACRPSFSASLRLYKLYVRAQGFAPLADYDAE